MRVVLDTDVVSNLLSRTPSRELTRRLAGVAEQQCLTAISLSELLYGIERSTHHEYLRELLETEMLPGLEVLPFDEQAAREYAVLRVTLERRGQMLDEADLRIASIALANRLALVTGNERHFRRVPGLRVYNWLGG